MRYVTLRNHSPYRVLDDFWSLPNFTSEAPAWQPAVEIKENEHAYTLRLEAPGVKRDEIHIEVENHQVVVSGEKKAAAAEKSEALYSERRFGKFSRTFALPKQVDTAKIEASFTDGVLQIFVPKAEAAKAREIKIN